jgi:tight adherence protein B
VNSTILVFGVVVILAVALIAIGLRRRPTEASAEEVMERMGRFASRDEMLEINDGDAGATQKIADGVEQIFKGRKVANKTAALLSRADMKLTVGEFLMVRAGAAVVGLAAGFFALKSVLPVLGVLAGIVLGLIGFVVPVLFAGFKASRRRKAFVNQLGDTITLMANSLRAGYSLLQTMEMVSKEAKDPIASEFSRVVREVGLGISLKQALDHLYERVPSDDVDFLITAINIQHEVGGNLAQILTTIGHTIRERIRIQGEIGVLTAQVKLSGTIVTLVPVGLAGILFLMNPTYMSGLFAWPYILMPVVSLIMTGIGGLAMKKIATIEV